MLTEVMDKVLEIKANKKEKREGQPFSTISKKTHLHVAVDFQQ
jgi:hypothetical protein